MVLKIIIRKKCWHLRVQNRGSSLESPQSLTLSQNLFSCIHFPLVHVNSDIAQFVMGHIVWPDFGCCCCWSAWGVSLLLPLLVLLLLLLFLLLLVLLLAVAVGRCNVWIKTALAIIMADGQCETIDSGINKRKINSLMLDIYIIFIHNLHIFIIVLRIYFGIDIYS